MSDKIHVLDIDIDNFTAKKAMRQFVDAMDSEPISVIELMTIHGLMGMDERSELKGEVGNFELVMAGDTTILESAGIEDRQSLREVNDHLFLKMSLRYLNKHHKRIYLLVESEEEGQEFLHYVEANCRGAQIAGMAKVSVQDRADDMIVNAINGADVDCVISLLSSPLQEDFAVKNRNVLNANVWLGLGKEILPVGNSGFSNGRFAQFIMRKLFQKEVEKQKKMPSEVHGI